MRRPTRRTYGCLVSRVISVLIVVLTVAPLTVASAAAGDASEPLAPGAGTQLDYEACYEQVGAFRVPVSFIRSLVGSELPAGFLYRTFDPAGTIGQLNVVGLSCEQGGHRVSDMLVNAVMNVPVDFGRGLNTLLRVRTYTDSPESRARYRLFCFGDVTRLADVEASVEIADTGARQGHVSASDGETSVEMTTTLPPGTGNAMPATLQHFTVEDGAVHGLIEWGNEHASVIQRTTSPLAATLLVDGVAPSGLTVLGAQHFYAAEGGPHRFFHRGLTRCAPGQDWTD